MDLTAPKTYLILLNVLARREFSQGELAHDLHVSVGHTSNIVRWLEDNQLVERRDYGLSKLVNPTGLLRTISIFRPMARFRRFTLNLDVRKEELLSWLQNHRIVFCLGTALERYSEFYRPDEISFYAMSQPGDDSPEALREYLAEFREGITKVSSYELEIRFDGRRRQQPDRGPELLTRLEHAGFLNDQDGVLFTTKVQTVIDLFGDGKAFATRNLLKELWQVDL